MMKDFKLVVLIQNYGGLYNNCLTKILLLQIRKNDFAGHQPINFLINTMNTEQYKKNTQSWACSLAPIRAELVSCSAWVSMVELKHKSMINPKQKF